MFDDDAHDSRVAPCPGLVSENLAAAGAPQPAPGHSYTVVILVLVLILSRVLSGYAERRVTLNVGLRCANPTYPDLPELPDLPDFPGLAYAASLSIKPISLLDMSLSMSTRISMRSSMVPRPIM